MGSSESRPSDCGALDADRAIVSSASLSTGNTVMIGKDSPVALARAGAPARDRAAGRFEDDLLVAFTDQLSLLYVGLVDPQTKAIINAKRVVSSRPPPEEFPIPVAPDPWNGIGGTIDLAYIPDGNGTLYLAVAPNNPEYKAANAYLLIECLSVDDEWANLADVLHCQIHNTADGVQLPQFIGITALPRLVPLILPTLELYAVGAVFLETPLALLLSILAGTVTPNTIPLKLSLFLQSADGDIKERFYRSTISVPQAFNDSAGLYDYSKFNLLTGLDATTKSNGKDILLTGMAMPGAGTSNWDNIDQPVAPITLAIASPEIEAAALNILNSTFPIETSLSPGGITLLKDSWGTAFPYDVVAARGGSSAWLSADVQTEVFTNATGEDVLYEFSVGARLGGDDVSMTRVDLGPPFSGLRSLPFPPGPVQFFNASTGAATPVEPFASDAALDLPYGLIPQDETISPGGPPDLARTHANRLLPKLRDGAKRGRFSVAATANGRLYGVQSTKQGLVLLPSVDGVTAGTLTDFNDFTVIDRFEYDIE